MNAELANWKLYKLNSLLLMKNSITLTVASNDRNYKVYMNKE